MTDLLLVIVAWALVCLPVGLVALRELQHEIDDARFDHELRQLLDREARP